MDVEEGRGSKFLSIDDDRGGNEICVNWDDRSEI